MKEIKDMKKKLDRYEGLIEKEKKEKRDLSEQLHRVRTELIQEMEINNQKQVKSIDDKNEEELRELKRQLEKSERDLEKEIIDKKGISTQAQQLIAKLKVTISRNNQLQTTILTVTYILFMLYNDIVQSSYKCYSDLMIQMEEERKGYDDRYIEQKEKIEEMKDQIRGLKKRVDKYEEVAETERREKKMLLAKLEQLSNSAGDNNNMDRRREEEMRMLELNLRDSIEERKRLEDLFREEISNLIQRNDIEVTIGNYLDIEYEDEC